MRNLGYATIASALLLAVSGVVGEAGAQSPATVPFPVASVHLERNATDNDFEVVFEVKGDEEGLAELTVVAPDRRTVVAFKAPDSSTSGIKALKAAYPEGVYEFAGRTFSGAKLVGKSTLSHRLAATATIVKPAPAAANVPVRALRLAWGAVDGVASYSIGIKQEELNVNLTALLPASSTSFAVPDGFLARGRKYTLAVGAVTREGNITFVETTFTTEK